MTRKSALFCLFAVGVGGCAYSPPARTAVRVAAASPEVLALSGEAGRDSTDSVTSDPTPTPAAPAPGTSNDTVTSTDPTPAPVAPPARVYFEGRSEVSYSEFVDELRLIADRLAEDPDVKDAHQVLLTEKRLTEEELPLESFSRARLAFESARDSGLWGIRGTVTDQMPWSDRIWEQWATRDFTPAAPVPPADGREFPTAVAECDELGALFSILARDLGVIGFVGLHWPY